MIATILTYVSIFAGGLLVILLLISLLSGLDLDLDIGGGDVDTDAGGMGLIKGLLTFVSVSSWVMKILVLANKGPVLVVGIGIFAGVIAFLLLNYLLKLLLRNQENVNWNMEDAIYEDGTVYLKIPGNNLDGLVNVTINGVTRELKAKSSTGDEIPTGTAIRVVGVEGDFLSVVSTQ